MSEPVLAEVFEVLHRPRLARFVNPAFRSALLDRLAADAHRFTPVIPVTDCRDGKDNKYLELALVFRATTLVSSDDDLLTLHPWRGIRIVPPANYLAEAGPEP